MQAILAAVQAEFVLAGVALPPRQYYTAGNVYYDAEQLSVAFVRTGSADQNSGTGAGGGSNDVFRSLAWRVVEVEIMLLRCAPQIEVLASGGIRAPALAIQQLYGQTVAHDAEIIQSGLRRAANAGSFGVGEVLVIGDFQTVGPDGDLGGGTLRATVSLV